MSKIVLGLDIGVTSVGWGLVDYETGKIIDAGVRLFEEGTADGNVDRRTFRSARRLKRRKSFRIQRMESLLKKEGILSSNYMAGKFNPYECRKKGLKEKLTNDELVCAMMHVAKMRGSSLEEVTDENDKEAGATKAVLSNNIKALYTGKYICEVQLEKLNEIGKIRGNDNIFKTSDYIREVKQILSNQDINEDAKNRIIDIISKRRHFSEGPGGPNSPTKYGRYLELNGEPIDLINKMRGTCSIYENELRAPINSYSYCLYNLLNDLNNLTLDGRKISNEEKKIIIEDYINKKGTITLKQLAKVVNVEESLIGGYRVDKNDKPLFTEFKGYNAIRKVIHNNELNENLLIDKNVVDEIIDVLTETKILDERVEKILKVSALIDERSAILLASIGGISQYGYLSYKALKVFIDEMLYCNENQMQIIQRLSLNKNDDIKLKGKTNIPFDYKDITNPVVIRAQREAIKVINEVRSHYKTELESIVIEMAREKNSKEEKNLERKLQANNEKINKDLEEYAKEKKLNGKLKQKLRLAIEQNWTSAYSNEPIKLDLLMNDDNAYEVDHILPLSLSSDDSFNNKVLVLRSENQDKGQRTPYEYFSSGMGSITFEQFTTKVLANANYKVKDRKKKIDNLLYKGNLLDSEEQMKFINRNLVDTRFATRTLLNELQRFFKVNNIDTKVFTIRGNITDQFRKKAKIEKDRDEYKHHAMDALIVAMIRSNKVLVSKLDREAYKERKNKKYEYKANYVIDKETGEILATDIFDSETMNKIKHIKYYEVANQFKFSYKVDRKINRSISDQTIYSTREVDGETRVIKKYKNIYDNATAAKIVKLFKDGDESKLLMYKNDHQTFNIISEIIKVYTSEKNPFVAYKNEHGYIRKYSKKGNGPIVMDLKYDDSKLGNHIDISNNYNSKNKKVVLLQVSPYRMDLYYDAGVYKFVTIRYSNIKQKGDKFYIDAEWYKKEKDRKNISLSAEFVCSFNRNDIIDMDGVKYRFIAVNNDKKNAIEVKPIDSYEKKQIMLTIGRKITYIQKYSTDVLGNLYVINKERLKLDF